MVNINHYIKLLTLILPDAMALWMILTKISSSCHKVIVVRYSCAWWSQTLSLNYDWDSFLTWPLWYLALDLDGGQISSVFSWFDTSCWTQWSEDLRDNLVNIFYNNKSGVLSLSLTTTTYHMSTQLQWMVLTWRPSFWFNHHQVQQAL